MHLYVSIYTTCVPSKSINIRSCVLLSMYLYIILLMFKHLAISQNFHFFSIYLQTKQNERSVGGALFSFVKDMNSKVHLFWFTFSFIFQRRLFLLHFHAFPSNANHLLGQLFDMWYDWMSITADERIRIWWSRLEIDLVSVVMRNVGISHGHVRVHAHKCTF